jgi:hypothetical protein
VETYAKTLGQVAVGVVIVGVGVMAIAAAPIDLGAAALSGGNKKQGGRPDWWGYLLCRECVEVAKEEERFKNY